MIKVIKQNIKKIPVYLMFIIFLLLIFFSLFYRINIYYNLNGFLKLLCILVAILLAYIFLKFIKKLDKINNKKIIIFFYISIIILELLSILFLRIKLDNGDLSMLYGSASRIVNGGVKLLDENRINYFNIFPFQMFTLFFFEIIIKIANLLRIDYSLFFTIINASFILLSIIFIDLIVKNKFGENYRKYVLFLSTIFVPIYLFVPIFYTDTLSMPFGIGAYYFYLLMGKTKNNKSKIIYLVLMTLLLGIGANFKITVLIVLIAIIIEILCNEEKAKKFGYVFAMIILTLFMYKIVSFVSLKLNPLKIDNNKAIPYSHWVMMGLNQDDKSYGGYYAEDYKITLSEKNVNNMKKKNLEVISERLKNKKIFGYANFLIHKLEVTWMDGAFVAPYKYKVYGLNNNAVYNIVNPNGKYFKLFLLIVQTIHYFISILFIYSLFVQIRKKEYINISILYIILGTLIFFMFWETRSRYILNNFMFMFIEIIQLINFKLNNK